METPERDRWKDWLDLQYQQVPSVLLLALRTGQNLQIKSTDWLWVRRVKTTLRSNQKKKRQVKHFCHETRPAEAEEPTRELKNSRTEPAEQQQILEKLNPNPNPG